MNKYGFVMLNESDAQEPAKTAEEVGALAFCGQLQYSGPDTGEWKLGSDVIPDVLYELRDREVLLILAPVEGSEPVHLCGVCGFVLSEPGEPYPRCALINEEMATALSDGRLVAASVEEWLKDQSKPPVPHPLEAELGKIQKALDGLEECPLGKLPPKHTFFLNPYNDERFTRCPGCGEANKVRKKPFLIHIDPQVLLLLNMSGRYCPDCDLIILHQDVVEDLLVRAFEQRNPEIIGNDYLIIGTVEPAYWRRFKGKGTLGTVIDNLHDFERVVIYEPMRPRWLPEESA